jgi:hypothetical protein
MKTLSGALSAALNAPVQKPALLVQVDFASTRRWSSMATVSWNGHSWAARDMRLDGLLVQPLRVSGTLVLGNEDDEIGTLVLTEGVQDRRIVVYGYDAAALGDPADAVWLCDAVGASAQVSTREVRITLRHRGEFVQSPRTYVTAQSGFTHLLPADTVLRINGIDMRLERRG